MLLLLLVLQAGTIGWLALFDRAARHLEPAPPAPPARQAAPIPEPFVVRSLATSEPMLVGSKTVALRSGPSPNFPAVGALDAGTEVVARARAGGPGGSTWIEIMAANGTIGFVPDGTIGFVPDGMVQPEPAPAPAIARAEPPKQTPAPKIQRAVAPKQRPTPKIKRAVKSVQPSRPKAVPPPPGVTCILPGGEEIQATRSDCRAQSGIIYQ